METIFLQHPLDVKKEQSPPTVMALGYFDGVHIGHQHVIEAGKHEAVKRGIQLAVMTFHPHPKEVLRKESEQMPYITPVEDKIEQMERLGIDRLYFVKFDHAFAQLTPQQFVDQYLIGLHVVHVVAGFDFTYGQLGKGTMETLPFHARNQLTQTTVAKIEREGVKISSTKIRELLEKGEVEKIPFYLGRDYEVSGTVIHGDKRGRTIGFPTANVKPKDRYIIPKTGVYAVEFLHEGQRYEGVCNVGYKPTFYDEKEKIPSIEVHLFNFKGNLYDAFVRVRFKHYIRAEKKFTGIEALVEQIKADSHQAQAFFEQRV
ncbi:bifunctional riboflavin kinase/FAD synthetase [Halalkalibacterium ligniniphilum]|uniref:bifunctional riboflavin kinase/FAD synthetase n=1 Tax=Halalkalibacterium ligniniphilum TaxID=1134413 RepID=UPI00034CB5CA|nr:bifunctional riboflavin kinase/FAD synthetase [Halalkalibacterium ligniniphilum]